jgi:hypothetical protein
MNLPVQQIGAVPKLALNRLEAAKALGYSPATLDRLAQRGLIRPCRATYRPVYSVRELERFLKENSAADYIPSQSRTIGLPGQKANQPSAILDPRSSFPDMFPSTSGEPNHNGGEQNES